MSKLFILMPALIASLMFAGCAGRTAQQAGSTITPAANSKITMELADPVKATAHISSVQFLFMTFSTGDTGKAGAINNGLSVEEQWSLGDFLFGPPVSRCEVAQAAAFNAIQTGSIDAVYQSKVSTETSGFSLLGLIGYGTASATVEGHGVKLTK
jgi:hypothetical protein